MKIIYYLRTKMNEQRLEETTTEIYCETRCSKYSFIDNYPSNCEECIAEPAIQDAKNHFYEIVSEEIKKQDLSLENLRKKDIERIAREIDKKESEKILR